MRKNKKNAQRWMWRLSVDQERGVKVRLFKLKWFVKLECVETIRLTYQSREQGSKSSSLTTHPNVNYITKPTKPHHYLNPKTPFQMEDSSGQPNTGLYLKK
jgi:hypothetical protein